MPANEARPPGCARHSATTESAQASPGDAGSSGSRAGGTTGTAEGADAKSAAEARPRGIEKFGVYFKAWTRANAPLWKARERSSNGMMLP